MFARIEEFRVKHRERLHSALVASVLPKMRIQPGFVDWMVLTSDYDPERMLALSFWNSKEEAMRFHHEHYEETESALRSSLKNEPATNFYEVDASTAHHFDATKAA